MTLTMSTYPNYENQVEQLVKEHLKLQDEPVVMAIYYAPERDYDDVFLFEVLEGYNGNTIEDDGDLLEVLYGPTPSFPLHSGNAKLHILLTNPAEFEQSAQKSTRKFQELKQAVAQHKSKIIFTDPRWHDLKKVLDV
jgi:hypothetical protein